MLEQMPMKCTPSVQTCEMYFKGEQPMCTMDMQNCKPECRCMGGFVRNKNWKCVSPQNCNWIVKMINSRWTFIFFHINFQAAMIPTLKWGQELTNVQEALAIIQNLNFAMHLGYHSVANAKWAIWRSRTRTVHAFRSQNAINIRRVIECIFLDQNFNVLNASWYNKAGLILCILNCLIISVINFNVIVWVREPFG